MHIAVDISPIDKSSKSAHKVRGVGKYISLLRENLERFDKNNTYTFTSNPNSVKADLFHYPYFDPFFITLPLRKPGKTVVTVHDLIPIVHKKEFPVGIKGGIKWEINKKILNMSDVIITDSVASKEDVGKIVGFDEKKIFPVYLSADESLGIAVSQRLRQEVRDKYSLPDKFFLYVGDVTWNKNLPRLIEAVKKAGVTLVMVGKALTEDFDSSNPWNKDRAVVGRQIRENSLLVTLGFVPTEDLAVLYDLATCLVMPSLDEGFGLPVLEAMQAGCPVITTKCGSLPEVGGDAVLYVDAYSSEDIAERISLIGRNEKLQRELSEKGIKQAGKFSIERMMKETIAVYNQLP